jgi:hypothetical protein
MMEPLLHDGLADPIGFSGCALAGQGLGRPSGVNIFDGRCASSSMLRAGLRSGSRCSLYGCSRPCADRRN